LDEQLLVKEGGKSQPVSVVLKRAKAAPASTGKNEEPAIPTTPISASPTSGGGTPWKTLGWVVGSAGIVGLGVGAAFGGVAVSDKNAAHCVNDSCDAGPLSSARQAAGGSTIGFIAGGVLLAGGAALVLFTPSDPHESVGAIRVAPLLGKNGGGFSIGGTWQ
jgi:hypothetical protein